jgi:hypothetical protein
MDGERRKKISAKIRALLAKTVENGCTEEEAVAAAAKAAELLDLYDLDLDEVEMRESPFEHAYETYDDPVAERLWKPAHGIAAMTGTRWWTSKPGVFPVRIDFFGFAHEVEIAKYLMAICVRAMRDAHARKAKELAILAKDFRRRRMAAFLDGMADSLRKRIEAMRPPKPTGTGLVVLRNALIDEALKDLGTKLKGGKGRPSRDFEPEYEKGVLAGERVSLSAGVGASTSPVAKIGLASEDGTEEEDEASEAGDGVRDAA